jgi:hypothetical protein
LGVKDFCEMGRLISIDVDIAFDIDNDENNLR